MGLLLQKHGPEPEQVRDETEQTRGGDNRGSPVLFGLAVALLLMLISTGGVAYAGYRYEQAHSALLLPGIAVAGVEVGGMTRTEAERAVAPAVSTIVGRTIQVRVGHLKWSRTARQLGIRASVEHALDQAQGASDQLGWTSRLFNRLLDRPLDENFNVNVSLKTTGVSSFVDNVAARVATSPRNASLDFVNGQVIRRRARAGQQLDATAAKKAIISALRHGRSSVNLKFSKVLPTVTGESLGKTIIIRLSQNRLYLYDGLRPAGKFTVATGQPAFPTPLGHFSVINKRVNPTWVNPAKKTWGKDAPDFIPPGPDNPLGTRALDLSAPGIRIHGTPDDASIGHYASHGCIRMHIPDSESLFGRVPMGTPVIIAW